MGLLVVLTVLAVAEHGEEARLRAIIGRQGGPASCSCWLLLWSWSLMRIAVVLVVRVVLVRVVAAVVLVTTLLVLYCLVAVLG